MRRSRPSWAKSSPSGLRVRVYALIAALTVLLVLHVGAQMYILSLGAEIQGLRKECGELEAETRTLELRIADLRKGERIKRIARERLGMEFPVGPPRKLF